MKILLFAAATTACLFLFFGCVSSGAGNAAEPMGPTPNAGGAGMQNATAAPSALEPQKSAEAPGQAAGNNYKEKQVWRYKTRDNENGSTITILKVEGDTIHIRIDGVRIVTKTLGVEESVGHAPIERRLLDESVTEYAGMSEQEPDLSGYETWKEKKGGVFSFTVADIVEAVQSMYKDA